MHKETLLSLQCANHSLSKSNISIKLLLFHLSCDALYLGLNYLTFLLVLITFFCVPLQGSKFRNLQAIVLRRTQAFIPNDADKHGVVAVNPGPSPKPHSSTLCPMRGWVFGTWMHKCSEQKGGEANSLLRGWEASWALGIQVCHSTRCCQAAAGWQLSAIHSCSLVAHLFSSAAAMPGQEQLPVGFRKLFWQTPTWLCLLQIKEA